MTPQSQPLSTDNGFPMLAIAILGITATAFLLISYYIFITKCCFRWHLIDPLTRFSHPPEHPSPSPSSSPPSYQTRGLNELLIRNIPTLQYDKETSTLSKCVVCLNDFQHHDMLRLLPKCNHAFHLDCIDVWLLSNSNCPLCRSAISGRNRYVQPVDTIVAPNSSPQHLQDEIGTSHSSTKMEIKIAKSKHRKFHHFSIMGDEGINVREKKDDDDQFGFQPIRRSFSMDSAIYIVGQVRDSEESSSRRSIFSFGQGRSKIALLPY